MRRSLAIAAIAICCASSVLAKDPEPGVSAAAPPKAPASSPLADLEWLVGQWGDSSGHTAVQSSISWTRNKAFLNYRFKISVPGTDELEGNQIIGWDPAAGTIRSWMFDSDGGFGEGVWSKKGNRWIVQFAQVLPDGRKASATNIYTLIDKDSFTWKSVGRKVDGQFLPNIDEVKIVRKSSDQPGKAGVQTSAK